MAYKFIVAAVRYSVDLGMDALDNQIVVIEDEGARFTGLYDQHGREIHDVVERVPMGFHHGG